MSTGPDVRRVSRGGITIHGERFIAAEFAVLEGHSVEIEPYPTGPEVMVFGPTGRILAVLASTRALDVELDYALRRAAHLEGLRSFRADGRRAWPGPAVPVLRGVAEW